MTLDSTPQPLAGQASTDEASAGQPSSSQPLRVLYLARAPFISGAERALLSTLRHLDRNRICPAVVLGCDSPLADQVRAMDVPVWIVPMAKRELGPVALWRWSQSLRGLRRIARQWRAEVLHANDVPSCQAMSVVGRELGLPRVVHVRWGISAKEMGWWARAGCERIVCISRWVRGELGSLAGTPLGDAKVEVIHDCVDWPADPPRMIDGPEHHGLVLGFSGQLIESKGLDLVIRAIGQLPSTARPRLLVAGKDTQSGGAYQRQLETLADECGVTTCIDWLGFLPDVSGLYQRIDAVVCPSRLEPLGLVPLEAGAYRLPAIANNLGGFRETIVQGRTGLLVEPTPEAWAGAMAAMSDAQARRAMGRAAYDHIGAAFGPMKYQERLASLYDGLAGR